MRTRTLLVISTLLTASGALADGEPSQSSVQSVRESGVALYRWYTARQPLPEGASGDSTTIDWSSCPRLSHDEAERLLVPEYIPALASLDAWGHPLEFCLNRDEAKRAPAIGVRSPGSDGKFEGSIYRIGAFERTRDEHDIVWADGYFVAWPGDSR